MYKLSGDLRRVNEQLNYMAVDYALLTRKYYIYLRLCVRAYDEIVRAIVCSVWRDRTCARAVLSLFL